MLMLPCLFAPLPTDAALINAIKAVVHDSVVTYDEVEQLTEQTSDVLVRQLRNRPEELQKKLGQVRAENLEKLMDEELILHEFETAGYQLPESVIDDLVRDRMKSRFGDQRTMTKTLQAQGLTRERFRQQVRRQFIVEAMRNKNVSSEILVSPFKIERFYLQHKNDYKVEEQVKLRTIILPKSGSGSGPDSSAVAREIRLKLDQGVPFAEMASLYSQGSERAQGGARPLQEVSELRKELSDAVGKLQPGQTSDVIDTPEAWWIIHLEQRIPEHIKPLGEVREEIEKELLAEERGRLEQRWIEKLRQKTFVLYF